MAKLVPIGSLFCSKIPFCSIQTLLLVLGWRKVVKAGLSTAYMAEKTFRNWTRSVLALAFLPINRIEAAVDRMRDTVFDKSSPFFEKMDQFKNQFLDYIEDVWLNGNYNPKIWNQWKKTKNLTNNNNEG